MAQDLSSKNSNFISRCVSAAQALKAARDTLAGLNSEYISVGYSGILTDASFTGNNVHLTLAGLESLFTSQGNLETFWAAGNGTNIDKCIP